MRLNRLGLAIGMRGVGKSTKSLELAVVTGKNIIIVDTVFNDVYEGFEVLPAKDIRTWKGDRAVFIMDNEPKAFDRTLQLLEKYQVNAYVVIEDSSRYISKNVSMVVMNFIINHRKFNFDLMFMYHFLGDVAPYICKQFDFMILFHTADNFKKNQDKWNNWETIKPIALQIKKNKNHNFSRIIKVND